jgi:hypothetical protein
MDQQSQAAHTKEDNQQSIAPSTANQNELVAPPYTSISYPASPVLSMGQLKGELESLERSLTEKKAQVQGMTEAMDQHNLIDRVVNLTLEKENLEIAVGRSSSLDR